jgi:structural maintenance of chromosomes protein 5
MSSESAFDATTKQFTGATLVELGFAVGTVIRVQMKNFLTYDDCQVFPGPRLNVVLGPNGTGKSTITHAICLACAGSPVSLGRDNKLSEFVKHGKVGEIVFVEVDLMYNDRGRTVNVRREIDSNKRSAR